jgi:hypothetical protein
MDCFAALAMTGKWRHNIPSSPPTGRANARPMTGSGGDPVRRGFSVQSLTSLEYLIPAFAGMTTECGFAISRHELPELCSQLPALLFRGRREDRVRAAPAVSCAKCAKEHAHEHTGTAGASRPSLRNGFTAYFVLFPANGFFATVAPEKRRFSWDLMPAPRHQNHTTSPYASGAYV